MKILRPWRGLRTRLTLSYVLFFALALALVGLSFHQNLVQTLRHRDEALLDADWSAVRSYLHVDPSAHVYWAFNDAEREEAAVVERLRRMYLLADLQGRVLDVSNGYRELSEADGLADLTLEIAATRRTAQPRLTTKSLSGIPYLIRQGIIHEGKKDYFFAIARGVADSDRIASDFTRRYLVTVPVLLFAIAILGWNISGRALRPLNDVVRSLELLSGTTLSLRLRPLGAGDELDTLIARFNEMVGRLERSFQQVSQFTIDASHELRTPITAIRGQLEVALFTAQTDQQYRDAIVSALEGVERLSQMVKSLLLLAQAENGQLKLTRTRLDPAPLLEEILSHFRMTAEDKHLRLLSDIRGPCWAELDRVEFERLVSCLLANAVKFTPPGGEVRIKLEARQGRLRLTVSDNGPGIPAEHLPHIFDRFYRVTHSEREWEKGPGLGLSFVKWIVEAHGGSIEVESTVGKGASFLVTLPAEARQDEMPTVTHGARVPSQKDSG